MLVEEVISPYSAPVADMALNEADKAWIRQEIQAAHKRHGLGKLTGFLKDWGGFGAAIAILIFVLMQWTGYIEFRTRTDDRLTGIEKNLARLELQNQASLSQSEFETTLPELRPVVAYARKQNVKVPPKVIEDLRAKLLGTSSGAPEFWPTVSEFINYRSMVIAASSEQVKRLLTERIPLCTDSTPKPMSIKEVLGPHEANYNPGLYENCRFTLDSSAQDQRINEILTGTTPFLKFRNCLIEYHGGEVNLILAWDKVPVTLIAVPPNSEDKSHPVTVHTNLTGPAIEFDNCLFDFSFQTAPPPKGQQLSTTLLAQNLASVTLPVAR